MLFTNKPLTRFLETWTAEHFGRHDDPAWQAYLVARQKYHALKTAEQAAEHSNQGLLGMSSAGSCLRAIAAKRAGLAAAALSGAELANFEVGHLGEVMVLSVLEAAGFEIDGTQTEARLEGTHVSAVDAVVTGGPVPELSYPFVLSVKTASWKMAGWNRSRKAQDRRGFAALPVGGIYREQFSWYCQLMLELAALKVENGVVIVLVKDRVAAWKNDPIMQESGSLAWYAESFKFNRDFAEELWRAHKKLVRDFAEFPMQAPARIPFPGEEIGELRWIELPLPGDDRGWSGPNAEAADKTFNRCFECQYRLHENSINGDLEAALRASLGVNQ